MMYIDIDGKVYDLDKLIQRHLPVDGVFRDIDAVLKRKGYVLVKGVWMRPDDTIAVKRANIYNDSESLVQWK